MNFVVVHSVPEEKFSASGCKSSVLLCVSSSKLDSQHFQAGVTRPLLAVVSGAWTCQGDKGDNATAAVHGRVSPLELHHVQPH